MVVVGGFGANLMNGGSTGLRFRLKKKRDASDTQKDYSSHTLRRITEPFGERMPSPELERR
jgi:hypothetical protein